MTWLTKIKIVVDSQVVAVLVVKAAKKQEAKAAVAEATKVTAVAAAGKAVANQVAANQAVANQAVVETDNRLKGGRGSFDSRPNFFPRLNDEAKSMVCSLVLRLPAASVGDE